MLLSIKYAIYCLKHDHFANIFVMSVFLKISNDTYCYGEIMLGLLILPRSVYCLKKCVRDNVYE